MPQLFSDFLLLIFKVVQAPKKQSEEKVNLAIIKPKTSAALDKENAASTKAKTPVEVEREAGNRTKRSSTPRHHTPNKTPKNAGATPRKTAATPNKVAATPSQRQSRFSRSRAKTPFLRAKSKVPADTGTNVRYFLICIFNKRFIKKSLDKPLLFCRLRKTRQRNED